MHRTRNILCAALLGASLLSAPAQAADTMVITSIDGPELHSLLAAMGLDPRDPEKDREGDPKVRFSVGDINATVMFYGCTDGRCASLQATSGFAMKHKPGIEKINEWNRRKRFSRAYLDQDGDPRVEADLDLSGGVSVSAVKEFFRTYRRSLSTFTSHIGFNR